MVHIRDLRAIRGFLLFNASGQDIGLHIYRLFFSVISPPKTPLCDTRRV